MYEIDYYLSTNKRWLTDFAESLSMATNEKVIVANNKLIFSPGIGEGRFEFFELEDGISLLVTDCVFHKDFRFVRKAIKSNDYYILHLNLSIEPVVINKESGRTVDIGSDWSDAVLFTSTGKGVELLPSPHGKLRMIVIIFHRTWGMNYIRKYPVPIKASRISDFVQDIPMQFTANLDLKSLNIAEEMIAVDLPAYILPFYLLGDSLKLLALFTKFVADDVVNEEKLKFDEVVRITNLKESIEKSLESSSLTIDDAAAKCLMSKTKFLHLFKSVYGKNFTDLVKEIKMQKAAELLREGLTVAEVGHKIGYSNLGHFAGAFKDHFFVTPKQYQKSFKVQ